MSNSNELELRLLSSLVKVFPDEDLTARPWEKGSMLLNEVYSFQVAYRRRPDDSYLNGNLTCGANRLDEVKVKAVSELSPFIELRKVEAVQSDLPCYRDHDEYVLRTEPGLYPDLLLPVQDTLSLSDRWQSLWVTIDLRDKKAESGHKEAKPEHEKIIPGCYPVEIAFFAPEGEKLTSAVFYLTIIDSLLPKQTLIVTEWFYADCLATYYKDEVFSEAHWRRIEQYIKTAVDHGINMILTPLFTVPLDTAVGGERPTVQLVDVKKHGNEYEFGFDRLKRWVDLCDACGVEYFEFSHLFTQWRAEHAPKIVAEENGELKKIFGWETDAAGPEYESFLDQFLPALVTFIRENGLEKRSYFHVSDEPQEEHLKSYANASRIVNKHLYGFPVIDALSSYEFYKRGLVKRPIPASDHIEPFLENKVPELWTYYCCGQYRKVSNRFFNMPSARNRILGMQLYKYDLAGFLQWGYNFWYTQYSTRLVDPFKETDAGKAFPSGDAFLVYPGKDGPLESIRLEVFYEALQDVRALRLLEELVGREKVIATLDAGLDTPITFSEYPRDDEWLLNKREEINLLISKTNFTGQV